MKVIIDHICKTDWNVSEIITMPKISGMPDCTKHRTLSLISHASKILLDHVIRQRINYYYKDIISEEQFGFQPGKGNSDAILLLRIITEKDNENC